MGKMLKSLLEIGQVLEIKYEQKDGDMLTLKANVLQVKPDDCFVITAPIHEAKLFNIHQDKSIEISVNRANAGTHAFRAQVIDRFRRNNINMLLLKQTGPIRYAQRRDFYRHSILMGLKIDIFTKEGLVKESISTMTKDISGGGVRIIIKKNLEKGTLVRCNIPIDGVNISPIGEVVRVVLMPDSSILHDVAISFTDILEKDRSRIISYIFKCQQKNR